MSTGAAPEGARKDPEESLVPRGKMITERSFYGAVEAGGTKFVYAIGDGLGNIHVEERFDTDVNAAALAEHRWGRRRTSRIRCI
jgi:predicted NBD/HSP70 family sugar kinase